MQLTKTNHVTVNVIDAIMGSGKTTWMIDKINNDPSPRYIVVTPTLTEVTRIISDCPKARFKEPEQTKHGNKYYSFKLLVESGENIVTTHSLFKLMTKETLAELKRQQYVLMVDESLAVVSVYKELTRKDITMLFSDDYVYVEPETFKLRWNYDKHSDYFGKFSETKDRCDNGNLIYHNEKTMLWEFPVEFLMVFKEVWVMTYLFNSSPMANYLSAEGTKVTMYSLEGQSSKHVAPTLIDYKDHDEKAIKEKLRPLINLYQGRLNDIGKKNNVQNSTLSKNWYANAKPQVIKEVKSNLANYLRNVCQGKSEDVMWTVFGQKKNKKNKHRHRGDVSRLEGKGYAKGFVSNNIKATNDYINKKHVAYMQNTFYHPKIFNYFKDRGVVIHGDLHSLSEMIQLIWRSQIRKWEPIDVYIPSSRMRHLFECWLKTNSLSDLLLELKVDQGGQDMT